MPDELKHVGVPGMKWGVRTKTATTTARGKSVTKLTTVRGKVVPKQEHARTSLKKVKTEKLSAYKQNKIKRERIVRAGRAVGIALLFAPSIKRYGTAAAKFGQTKISDYMTDRAANKYGGFDPRTVVEGAFK